MGLFGWGKKKQRFENLPDLIWMTTEFKYVGFAKEIAQGIAAQTRIVVVTHFPDELQQVVATLQEYQIPNATWSQPWASGDIAELMRCGPGSVIVTLASHLPSLPADESPMQDDTPSVRILSVSRHPLRSEDERIEQFASALPCRSSIRFHLSIDDPLLATFVDDSIRRILAAMEMPEDEPIESKMIARRIEACQKKLKSESKSNSPANSAAEWLSQNV